MCASSWRSGTIATVCSRADVTVGSAPEAWSSVGAVLSQGFSPGDCLCFVKVKNCLSMLR